MPTKLLFVYFTESAYYVPKGYYVIHADGQQSALSKITPSHVSVFALFVCLFFYLFLTYLI